MKLKVVDLNDPELYQEWKNTQPKKSGVYVWEIKDLILEGKIFKEPYDAYVFLWDDGKGKHESYELNFVIPYNPIDNNLSIDETWYGENRSEATRKFIIWFQQTNVKLEELLTLSRNQLPF